MDWLTDWVGDPESTEEVKLEAEPEGKTGNGADGNGAENGTDGYADDDDPIGVVDAGMEGILEIADRESDDEAAKGMW